ncbi:MAG: DUF2608 domain-containing protein [Parachlamydiaceae bacterium]|nr:DUF2608 domain-containing protein [Parachlamydiaceae bacterium]
MKRKWFQTLIFSTLITFSSILPAVIIETAHFAELVDYATPDSLVLLDIDDTLLVPLQTLGTDVWFCHLVKQYAASGVDPREALEMALMDWKGVRYLTKVSMVEEGSDRIVKELQQQNIPVMGLTTQSLALSTITTRQLNSLNIDLTRTAPSSEEFHFLNGQGVLYRKGLLSTSGTAKGPALLKYLDMIGCKPQHIVFINDKATHLRDVESAVEARGIQFTGLRYSFSDTRVMAFDPEIADIQWKYSSMGHILSDEEARKKVSQIN